MNKRWIALTTIAAGLLYGVFVFLLWNAYHRDISKFIVISAKNVDARNVPPGITLRTDIEGYDGTAFYRLALDPFTRAATAYGITLDVPVYRQQRILYPLLAWLLAFGRAQNVPWTLVIVNLLAAAGLGAAGAALADAAGRHPLWGLLFPLYPGFIYSVSRDLAEALACAFAVAAIAAIARKRYVLAGIFLGCAVLTRETLLGLAIAWLIAWAWSRVRGGFVVFAIPAAAYATWQLILRAMWGKTSLQAGLPRLAIPLAGYWHALVASSSLKHLHRLHFYELAYLAIFVVLAIVSLKTTQAILAWRIAFVGYLVLGATLSWSVWSDNAGYMRILSDCYIVSATIIVQSGRVVRWILAVASAIVWYSIASHYVQFP